MRSKLHIVQSVVNKFKEKVSSFTIKSLHENYVLNTMNLPPAFLAGLRNGFLSVATFLEFVFRSNDYVNILWVPIPTPDSLGTCLVFLKCEIPWHNWVLKLMYILQVPHCYLFSHLSLFYWTCNCQSPLNPHKRWSDKIVFWSRDITSNYWVENNWWPWDRRSGSSRLCVDIWLQIL